MKKIIPLAALIACAAVNDAGAETNSALSCLHDSAQSDGLAACLNESGKGAPAAVTAETSALRTQIAPSLGIAPLADDRKRRSTMVPTPTGYTSAEEGTLKAGFYNGLDSGFKSVFAGIEYLPVRGMEAFGNPYESNAGTIAFGALGILLAIPAGIIAAVLGAPIGAVAGMIAEKVTPGSTNDWFTF